jgi:hypothetical protein
VKNPEDARPILLNVPLNFLYVLGGGWRCGA